MENKIENSIYHEIRQYKPLTLEEIRLNESLKKYQSEELKNRELTKYEKAKLYYDAKMFRN